VLAWTLTEDEIVQMPLDALGLAVLRDVASNEEWHQHNWILKARQSSSRADVLRALEEAWAWLRSRVLVAHDPSQSSEGAIFVTRRGRTALQEGLAQTRAEERLELDLHPALAEPVRSQFLLGQHELAVFAAFRSVEERVRRLAGASPSDIGVPLMNSSFRAGGPLALAGLDGGEVVARMQLFAGAIGVFKNPSSHRTVDYQDVTAASEAVMFADLLHRILDEYRS
jgi:uncharacterized protein (TIGR02391 family)